MASRRSGLARVAGKACSVPPMTGRFAIVSPPERLKALFGWAEQPSFPPRANIAPTQPIPIVRAEAVQGRATRRFALVRWGFLPGFVDDPAGFPLLFNARAEGIGDKASFRNALRRRRCLVPADAFYLWQRLGASRDSRPWMGRRADGEPMGLAGLWETWAGPNGEEVDTACIVTAAANALSSVLHPRLPVVVARADFATWLDPDELALGAALALLRPPGEDVLAFAPIGEAVNKASNDGPEVMAPIGPPLAPPARAGGARQPDLFPNGGEEGLTSRRG